MPETISIASFNINGIRAAHKRGFTTWLNETSPDVVALQEVRCRVADLPLDAFGDYYLTYDPGTLPGRNGVGFLTKQPPAAVRTWGADVLLRAPGEDNVDLVEPSPTGALARGLSGFVAEGRYIEIDLADQPLTLANLYLPKGGLPAELQVPGRMRDKPDGGAKYLRKQRFMASFSRQLKRSRTAAKAAGREFLLMGDLNVAHQNVDVTNWRSNQKTDGFLPEEREWIGAQLSPRTLVDVVRSLHGDQPGPYTWWSWMGQSYAKDVGWRIDYHLASPALAKRAQRYRVYGEQDGVRMSDHAALLVEYSLPR